MSSPAVLIFTYPEYGQANVNLATAYGLALAGVNVYVASFASVRARVSRLQELIVHHASRSSRKPTGSVTFYECKGSTPYGEAIGKRGITIPVAPHLPGVSSALGCYPQLDVYFFSWYPEGYLAAIESCKEVMASIRPKLVVINITFYPAQDACSLVNQKFMIISPSCIKDIAMNAQPCLAPSWKYPAPSSGFPFPLNDGRFPSASVIHRALMTLVNVKQIEALHESLGLTFVFALPYHGVKHICPSLAETEFSFAVIPEEIHQCGRIVMPFDPLEESDPASMKWLDNGLTAMMNLGLHILYDVEFAREMTGAIRILLDHHDRKRPSMIRVLRKVKANGDIQKVIDEIIGKEIREARVKVVARLEAEPVAIL